MVKRIKPEEYTVGKETHIKKILDKQSVAWNQARVDERKGKKRSMYASDYGQCMKKTFFNFFPDKYPTDAFDPRVLRIFHNGEDVHERLSEYLEKEEGFFFEQEVDVPRDDLQVHGRCDGISTVEEQAVIVEFKSINRTKVYEAKEEHKGQVMWYMMMFKKLRKDLKEDFGYKEDTPLTEEDLKGVESVSGRTINDLTDHEQWIMFTQGEIRGEVIYESKPNQSMYCFPVDYNEDESKKIRLWYEQLKWHVDKQIPPNVKYDKNKFPCSWGRGTSQGRCAYYEQCWGKDDAKKDNAKKDNPYQ